MHHRDNAMFGAIQFAFWSGFGLIFAFLSAYYQDIGFTTVQIGLVMALVAVSAIAGQPVLGLLSDRIGAPGLVLRNGLVVGVVLAIAMFLTPRVLLPVALLSVLISISVQTLPPILDGWTMEVRDRVPRLDYGLTRSMGSIGFALTVAFAGRLFDAHGIEWMFLGAAAALGVTLVIVTLVHRYHLRNAPSVADATPQPVVAGPPPAIPWREFFSARMIGLLVIFFLAFTAFRPVQVFLPVLFRQVGGTNQDLGFAFSIMAISEIPFLIAFTFLVRRFRDTHVMLVALVFFLFRIGIHSFATTPLFVILAQGLQGPSFGLFLPASVHLLNRIAPAGTRTFAQSAGAIASFGLGSMSGSAVGGYLVDWLGITEMFLVMAGVMAAVIVAYVLLFIVFRPDRGSEQPTAG
ncbi:MAG: MFS transporter [Spirochaetaceae bacterium]|nr:MAG: MFS transporter [Spirochaetaceae bacterium]